MSAPSRQPSKAQESRRAARELAVQGLYQWQMTGKSITAVEAEFRAQIADEDLEDHENWHKVMEIADALPCSTTCCTTPPSISASSMPLSRRCSTAGSRISTASSWRSCAWAHTSCRGARKFPTVW